MGLDFETFEYRHFGDCTRVSNGVAELLVARSFGPRILGFALSGQGNLFYEQETDHKDLETAAGWRVYGGHRLWLAPESPEAYYPDEQPVEILETDDGFVVRQEVDPWLSVRKEVEVCFAASTPIVRVVHRITNLGADVREGSLWAITALRAGGVQTIPFCPPDTGMAPNRFLSFWSYSDPADERFEWTDDGITIQHKPLPRRFKLGLNNYSGTAHYDVDGTRFTKRYLHDSNSKYPDNNVSYQTFLCRHMIEMETLSPLFRLQPGQTRDHTEEWELGPSRTETERC